MKKTQIDRGLLMLSIYGYLVMSISFLLMPFESMGIASGVCFWAGLLLGTTLQVVLEIRRRAFFARIKVDRRAMQKNRNGLLSFGSNLAAKIADWTLAVSLVATTMVFVLTGGYGFVCYVCIAVTLFSFCLHCILNGRIYVHAKHQDKIQQVLEERKSKKKEGEGKI